MVSFRKIASTYINNILHLINLHISRYPQRKSNKILDLICSHAPSIVFDVGANIGQFAGKLRGNGYNGLIISFEPLSEAFSVLEKHSNADIL